jgi:hypothetical protein
MARKVQTPDKKEENETPPLAKAEGNAVQTSNEEKVNDVHAPSESSSEETAWHDASEGEESTPEASEESFEMPGAWVE